MKTDKEIESALKNFQDLIRPTLRKCEATQEGCIIALYGELRSDGRFTVMNSVAATPEECLNLLYALLTENPFLINVAQQAVDNAKEYFFSHTIKGIFNKLRSEIDSKNDCPFQPS